MDERLGFHKSCHKYNVRYDRVTASLLNHLQYPKMCFMNLFITCPICQLMFTHSRYVLGNCVMGIALLREPYGAARITHTETSQLRIINDTVAKAVLNHFNSIQQNYKYSN